MDYVQSDKEYFEKYGIKKMTFKEFCKEFEVVHFAGFSDFEKHCVRSVYKKQLELNEVKLKYEANKAILKARNNLIIIYEKKIAELEKGNK